jgi:hypothetical protein
MALWATQLRNAALNLALGVLGVVVVFLLYALVMRTLTARTDPSRASESTPLVGQIIQVEVRNGCGVDRLATEATQFLRDRGFDVVEVGNYSTFEQQRSLVIDRIGDLESARKVAEALGLPADRVRQDIDKRLYLDASVVIGHDYEEMRPFALPGSPNLLP